MLIHEANALVQGARHAVSSAGLYAATARRAARARRSSEGAGGLDAQASERPVFVVGSPRSGTTFLAGAVGAAPGFADLTEVGPLKAAIPRLTEVGDDVEVGAAVRRILERVRRLARIRALRAVEQTPEMAFLVPAALAAYPQGRVIHIVRDGRDVVTSLLERGWLSRDRAGGDDAGLAYGAHRRFWVEPARARAFEEASDARRAAWAWRTYVGAASAVHDPRVLELRYETLVQEPEAAAERLGAHLGASPGLLAGPLARAHARSVGRYRSDLTPDQLADVLDEAGPLLERLGYDVA